MMADISHMFSLHVPTLSHSMGSYGCFNEFCSHTEKNSFPLSNANWFIPPYPLIFFVRNALSLEIIHVFV